MPIHIEINEIRAFKAVCDENGFSKAADKLFVTQSAISQTISNLEKKLDTLLIERNPLKLTPAGARMLDYAEAVLKEEQTVMMDIKNIKQGVFSTLLLAMSGTVSKVYGSKLMDLYLAEFPLTSLKTHVIPSRQIISSLRTGLWELGFGPFQHDMPAEFHCIPLFEDFRRLVLNKKTKDFDSLLKDPDKLLKEIPLVISHLDDPDLRPTIDKLRDSFGTIWEINDLTLRSSFVTKGWSMGYFDQRVLSMIDPASDLSPLSVFPFFEMKLTFGVYYPKKKNLSAAALHFIEICRNFDFS